MTTVCTIVPSPNHQFPGHEEAPSRFRYLKNWDSKPYRVEILDTQPAPRSTVTTVHSERMLDLFAAACRQGPGITDYAPTFVTPSTFADAFLAVGGVLACTDHVLKKQATNGFAIIRPPGHHAEPEASMGFCLLNNVAIAVQYALRNGLDRVLIFDFDAHHGNGTQAVFWNDSRVAYISTHQENIYPYHTGFPGEAPHARGRIVNLPLPGRTGDKGFARIFDRLIIPLVKRFSPDMIFISAGFDSHWNDPLADLGLSSGGYYDMAVKLTQLANEFCNRKLVFVLEGGYNPINIATGVDASLSALTGTLFHPLDPSPYTEPDISDRLESISALHGL